MRPSLPTMVLLPLGTLLKNGKYRLEQLLEHHAGELVYEGTHLPSQQPVIINTLNPANKKPEDIARLRTFFLEQAQVQRQLKHPHIEPVLDVFVESVLPFLVKDKTCGQTWTDLVRHQPLSEAEAISKIAQIGSGLTLIHQHHLSHGNIRPENVVVQAQTSRSILVRMGLGTNATDQPLSLAHHGYAAPEHYQGQQTSVADIYGLTATFYTLLTGQAPITAVQRQHIRFEPEHPHLSQTTIVAILRGMAIQPDHRPQSVAEWIELLPEKHLQPASFTTESGNIGTVSSALLEEPEEPPLLDPLISAAEDVVPPQISSSETVVSLQEQAQTVPSTRLQSLPVTPRFPIRALIVCSILSGVVGVAFGLTLRFHLNNQFNDAQVPTKNQPVETEEFLPKSQPKDQQLETLPTPNDDSSLPVESPEPPTLDDPAVSPRNRPGELETEPVYPQTPEPLAPDSFESTTPNPNLPPPTEPYPDRLSPEISPNPDPNTSTFDPFSTPDSTLPPPIEAQPNYQEYQR